MKIVNARDKGIVKATISKETHEKVKQIIRDKKENNI